MEDEQGARGRRAPGLGAPRSPNTRLQPGERLPRAGTSAMAVLQPAKAALLSAVPESSLAELSMPFAFQSRYSRGATSNPICRARPPDRRFTSTKFPTRIFAALCRRYSPRPNSGT